MVSLEKSRPVADPANAEFAWLLPLLARRLRTTTAINPFLPLMTHKISLGNGQLSNIGYFTENICAPPPLLLTKQIDLHTISEIDRFQTRINRHGFARCSAN